MIVTYTDTDTQTLALQPLTCAIRNNQNITNFHILFGYDFKAILYADMTYSYHYLTQVEPL